MALVMHNCTEYLEALYGVFRARAAPFNVNQHYQPAEVGTLLADLEARAVIYQRALGPLVAAACDTTGLVLVDVDDGSGVEPLPGSTSFEVAAATPVDGPLPVASPDDLYMVCTGGTTGRPKAVLWRQGDAYVAAMNGGEDATADSIEAGAAGESAWYATPPLMHAAAQWTALSGVHAGATIVVHDDSQPFEARHILQTVEREKVMVMSIVGDAYAAPLVEELRTGRYDLSSLFILGTGGAATGDQHKQALLELLPDLTIMDGYGSSETGGMAFGATSKDRRHEAFTPSTGAAVVSADLRRFLQPGEAELGWTDRDRTLQGAPRRPGV